MNTLPFRKYHLLNLLNSYSKEPTIPLDLFISHYYRKNKALGSKDRKKITELVYKLIRWQGLIDYFAIRPIDWLSRINIHQTLDLSKTISITDIPLHIRASFPKNLFNILSEDYGPTEALGICHILNEQAPATIRTNLLRVDRDTLFDSLKKNYPVEKTKNSLWGITFKKRIIFFQTDEFQKGFFEVQDEASQLIADLVKASPKDKVLDYCSGSGGKSLAIAPAMQEKGQIFLHDIRPQILLQAKKRLKRAGVFNAQIVHSDSEPLKKLEGKMDWVLLDVPCTGTGTLRRNPDMKWKFQESNVQELLLKQKDIFSMALKFLKPKGKIVYATCSILKCENEKQINFFTKQHSLILETTFKTLPQKDGMDGFFGAILKNAPK